MTCRLDTYEQYIVVHNAVWVLPIRDVTRLTLSLLRVEIWKPTHFHYFPHSKAKYGIVKFSSMTCCIEGFDWKSDRSPTSYSREIGQRGRVGFFLSPGKMSLFTRDESICPKSNVTALFVSNVMCVCLSERDFKGFQSISYFMLKRWCQ